MTVRLCLIPLLIVVCFAAGCGGDDGQLLPAETDEPLYLQAQQLKRQGRNPEALVNFLKVIEKRGEQAGESHLEAGLIYLDHHKEFIEAIHHFQRYLALQPNSRQAPLARELVNTAKREFARTLPAMPPDQLSGRRELAAENEALRRENDELRAQNATLRGGNAAPISRTRNTRVLLPAPTAPAEAMADESPLSAAPVRVTPPDRANANAPAPSGPRVATSAGASGRIRTVRAGEYLFAIAREADPANPGKKMKEIVDANPDVLPQGVNTPLKVGMELRVP